MLGALKMIIRLSKNLEDMLFKLYEPLTKGELQVLHLIAAGYSGNEIADALHKSVGRIRNITSAILAKLQVRDRTRAALKAIELGLI